MQLTRHTDYSFRVLIYLGLNGANLVTIKEIADSFGISKNHLMKVVHRLSQLGYIKTVRGKGGGLALGMDPKDIPVGAIVRHMEDRLEVAECFSSERNTCPITRSCKLTGVFGQAMKGFLDTLDKYTLADVLCDKNKISDILHAKSGG
ncbi:MAG: Rrf2 family transcriptional regulator [Nitrospinae bacterium]|nr:Rrf2 family transcriptional regulator [Nitrospinota bacterium]